MSKNRFDLEQEIMDCWQITTAIDDLCTYVGNSESFSGMEPKHQDLIMNYLLGLKTIYDVKFERTFDTFEECCKQRLL